MKCGVEMNVGIIGSRNCKDFNMELIKKYLPENCTEIISGGADGIDTYVEMFAKNENISFRKYLPDYKKYGRRAPLERNLLIVKKSDTVLAFWDCYSRGTAHTIDACIKAGVSIRVIPL